MAISGDYSSPITVNGFVCRNCSDVAKAEKNIDPADPTGAKERAKEEARTSEVRLDQQKAQDVIATHKAQQERAQPVNAPYSAGNYRPPEPGSLVNLNA